MTYPVAGSAYDGSFAHDSTSGLAITAANGYSYHKNVTGSYYSTDASATYLNSASRFGGSRIFFIAGHANTSLVVLASRNNNPDYVTGIYTGTGTYKHEQWKLIGMGNRNFTATRIITFAGCHTGAGTTNLATTAISRGAKSALGFTDYINLHYSPNINWLKEYNYAIGAGKTILQAKTLATAKYNNEAAWYSKIFGNTNTTMSVPGEHLLMDSRVTKSKKQLINFDDEETYIRVRKNFDDIYEVISDKNISISLPSESFIEEDLGNHKEKFIKIINEIKKKDINFDIDNYKVGYQLDDVNTGTGVIYFVYYINGNIRTNKIYTAYIENFNINKISQTSIEKENIYKISQTNEKSIINKLINFNNKKEENVIKKIRENVTIDKKLINEDKTINVDAINEVTNLKEIYEYDYITGKLTYYLNLMNDNKELNGSKGYTMEI